MKLYINDTNELKEVNERPFKLEKDIQKLFEKNLTPIMGLELVKSEFTVKNRRIDTLAFDVDAKAFIIIEYKRDKNYSVVDQGVSYLNLMLEYKGDFIVEYNESLKKNLKRDDLDWSQTRVAFISNSFTENQKQATNFKDLAIELWEVKQYENKLITINPIKKSMSAPSIKQIAIENETLKYVAKEILVYTEEDLLKRGTQTTIELYEKFKNSILNLNSEIEVQPRKDYVAFKKGKNITDITILKKVLKIWINLKKGNLDDPKNIADDVSKKGHWGNGDYQIHVNSDKDLEYIMSLIKQAIK
jgi:predicted transport protein